LFRAPGQCWWVQKRAVTVSWNSMNDHSRLEESSSIFDGRLLKKMLVAGIDLVEPRA
jgi:hypothetical protein